MYENDAENAFANEMLASGLFTPLATGRPRALALAVVRPSKVLFRLPSLSKRLLKSPCVAMNDSAGPACRLVTALRSVALRTSATKALRTVL